MCFMRLKNDLQVTIADVSNFLINKTDRILPVQNVHYTMFWKLLIFPIYYYDSLLPSFHVIWQMIEDI